MNEREPVNNSKLAAEVMDPGSINGEELLLHRPTSRHLGHSPRAGPRLVDRDGPFGQSCEL